jgi:hypothetical protein
VLLEPGQLRGGGAVASEFHSDSAMQMPLLPPRTATRRRAKEAMGTPPPLLEGHPGSLAGPNHIKQFRFCPLHRRPEAGAARYRGRAHPPATAPRARWLVWGDQHVLPPGHGARTTQKAAQRI